MQKMFTTQLMGLFKRIMDHEEYSIEDGARLLAQAAAGEGTIFIKGFDEMDGVTFEALEGAEPLKIARRLESVASIESVDRVLILTRYSDHEEAIKLAEELAEKGIPFVAISGNRDSEGKRITDLADVHIHTHLLKPLLPGDDGNRVGFPSLMAGLYIYSLLKFALEEILEDYED
ncbi:DUF2529 domain-containing protein [Bacillus niameyensis]|uniref:DUF2529 domain-containing protein n=1 Tax=Bacillus niameyensis TaxID=1522308 RepID=UPI000783AD4C|nr:DUF2529 domain-containing protein [Bacillus niameyensis]